MKSFNTSKLVLVFLGAFLTACSTSPQVREFPDTANASEEFRTLDASMTTALANQVNVLSPRNYEEAKDSMDSAKKSLDAKKDSKETLHKIAESTAYLNRAKEVATVAHVNMEDVVSARQQAISAGAPELFASSFHDADDNLKDVTRDLEKNNIDTAAAHRSALQDTYRDLELRSIKKKNLDYAQAIINEARKNGAKEYASQSLAIAEKSYKDTDAYINANRHESAQIQTRTAALNRDADHLMKITQEAKDTKKVSPEDLALRMESKQNQVNTKNNELTLEKKVAQDLATEKQSLESDKALNDKFEQARGEFSKEEAEVYKQGDTLVIRLRGLEFPTSQAVLKGSNFPLLAKVQRVIKEFGKSSVVVEGHTDSEGGKAKNDKLSTDRAQAVREYLLSIDSTQEGRITAVGYGYQKPLASNKTVAGRAQNRRVDILIKPESTQTL